MIVNSDIFHASIFNRIGIHGPHKWIIDNNEIKTTNSIKLLGITIDGQLKLNEHI